MEMTEHEVSDSTKTEESEVSEHLVQNDYRVCEYPNGLTMGLRLQNVPGSRGVHVDVVHVLDMRKARFGRTDVAVQSELLETVGKDTRLLLSDVGLDSLFEKQEIVTPFGRTWLRVLRPPKTPRGSLIYETRSVYGVYSGRTVPPSTVRWLTDPSRIIRVSELALLHKSDSRSSLQEVKSSIDQGKWRELEKGHRAAWWSLLPLVTTIASFVGLVASLITASGTLLIPLIALAVSLPLLLWLARRATEGLDTFQAALVNERVALERVGDVSKIREAVEANAEKLRLSGNLRFVITPLMGGAGVAIESGDVASAASSLCAILDECVVHSPGLAEEKDSAGDLGLKKFIELFLYLGVDLTEDEEMELSLAYAALTGHRVSPLSQHEVINHMGVLNNALFDCGILSADVKSSIDDMMNLREAGTLVKKYEDEDASLAEVEPPETSDEESSGIDMESLEEMSVAGVKKSEDSFDHGGEEDEDSDPVLVAKTFQTTLDVKDEESEVEHVDDDTASSRVAKAVEERPERTSSKKEEREAIEA